MKTVKLKKLRHDLITSMDVNGFAIDFLESLSKDDLFFDEFERTGVLDNSEVFYNMLLVCLSLISII